MDAFGEESIDHVNLHLGHDRDAVDHVERGNLISVRVQGYLQDGRGTSVAIEVDGLRLRRRKRTSNHVQPVP